MHPDTGRGIYFEDGSLSVQQGFADIGTCDIHPGDVQSKNSRCPDGELLIVWMYFFRAVHGFSACAEVSVGFEVNPYPFPRNAFRGVSLFFQYILTDLVNDNFGKGLFVTGSPSFIPVFLLHQFGYGLPS